MHNALWREEETNIRPMLKTLHTIEMGFVPAHADMKFNGQRIYSLPLHRSSSRPLSMFPVNRVSCLVLALLAAIIAGQPPVLAQSNKPAGQAAQEIDDEVVSIDTSEVLLPVTVRDAVGRLVTTLKRENFRVREDEREQPLSDLALSACLQT